MPDTKSDKPRTKRPHPAGRPSYRMRKLAAKRAYAAESTAMTYKRKKLERGAPKERSQHNGNAPLRKDKLSDAGKMARALAKKLRRFDALEAKAAAGEKLDRQQLAALEDARENRAIMEKELSILMVRAVRLDCPVPLSCKPARPRAPCALSADADPSRCRERTTRTVPIRRTQRSTGRWTLSTPLTATSECCALLYQYSTILTYRTCMRSY